MSSHPRAAIALWLIVLALAGWQILRSPITTDLAAFLPPSATRNQQLLIEQLREGVASRVVLLAIEGGNGAQLAQISRELASRMKASHFYSYVNNGDVAGTEAEREVLMRYRYLLSPRINADRFSVAALRASLQDSLQLLISPAGYLYKSTVAADPTGELLHVLSQLDAGSAPAAQFGVWFSADGKRALLLAETLASGFDALAQQKSIDALRSMFAEVAPGARTRLLLSGPGVFAAESRAVIERDAWRLSLIATVLVVAILYAVYRAWRIVMLSALPVLTGLAVGVAAVGWFFGSVHGITLGFGATLIGEAVDYPSYLFTHVAPGETVRNTLQRIWPTLRLAVLTTVFGGLTLLLSSFAGLSQLGLLSVSGVFAAGLVTRWLLPELAAHKWRPRRVKRLPLGWVDRVSQLRHAQRAGWICAALALAVIVYQRDRLWSSDLADLSPVTAARKALDLELRSELGAPDARYLVLVSAPDQEQALTRSEGVARVLAGLVAKKDLAGFDLAARYLPSTEVQQRRLAALPDHAVLQAALGEAARGLPFRSGVFAPFLRDIDQTRSAGLLTPAKLGGTALFLKVRTLLFARDGEWVALVPLRGVAEPADLKRGLEQAAVPGSIFLDLKTESNELVNGYRNETLRLTAFGILAIIAVLGWGLRRPRVVARVIAPVLLAVVIDVACLLLIGERLTLFHLVSLLLVIGIGLNYALFFARPELDPQRRRLTFLALTVCFLTTFAAFGCLVFSATPVLHSIGLTVSLGAVWSMLLSALMAAPDRLAA